MRIESVKPSNSEFTGRLAGFRFIGINAFM